MTTQRPITFWLALLVIALAIVLFALSWVNQWWSLVVWSVAGMLFGVWHVVTTPTPATAPSARAAAPKRSFGDGFWAAGKLTPADDIVWLYAGDRDPVIEIGRRISQGHITAVDIYNPGLMPSHRRQPVESVPDTGNDPRFTWIDSAFDLLPFADGSVNVAVLYLVLGKISEAKDQEMLLQTIQRMIRPSGKLVVVESNSDRGIVKVGSDDTRPQAWADLFTEMKFESLEVTEKIGRYQAYRMYKSARLRPRQLIFDF